MTGRILFRCDASVAIGTGHVMRCLALAQACSDAGCRAIFAMAAATSAMEKRLRSEDFEVTRVTAPVSTQADADETVRLARQHSASWVVVDGYQFGAEYQAALKSAGLRVLFIDDNGHAARYSADLVLNQNAYASEKLYAGREAYTRLLLGPRFALLRREFNAWRGWKREIPRIARKVLVTMGGSDPENLTTKVIDAIRRLSQPEVETIILVGGSNPHLGSIDAGMQTGRLRLITDASNVPELMAWADVAVAGAGTTFWEMCFLGLPGVLLVLAENQERIANAGEKLGTAWSLGRGAELSGTAIAGKLGELLCSETVRQRQSASGRRVVDGRGAERVAAILSGLELRRTTESDCKVFWEWANDPAARAASFRNKTISWDHHTWWFRAKLADPNAILYTATNGEGLPMGEVRFQLDGARAVISIGLGAAFRGSGWGRKLLRLGIERLFQESAVNFVDAYVKPSNQASLKLFSGGGFEQISPKIIEGQEAIHFVMRRIAGA